MSHVLVILSFDRVKQALEPLERGSCGRVQRSVPIVSAGQTEKHARSRQIQKKLCSNDGVSVHARIRRSERGRAAH